MDNYYNEHDPKAAAWLRELIIQGHIAPGIVDERSIEDVTPGELEGFTQCHFFAGIGVWSHALRRAGWDDDREVWTASCPCQPFSAAGKSGGFDDERHLWPAFYYLAQHAKRPHVPVFGEQVASKDGLAWLDLVQADMEAADHSFRCVDMCAAGVGAPHIRQRLFFVADARSAGREGGEWRGETSAEGIPYGHSAERGEGSGMEHPEHEHERPARSLAPGAGDASGTGEARGLADAERKQEHEEQQRPAETKGGRGADKLGRRSVDNADKVPDPTNGIWRAADWLFCRDGKWRPVEPGTFPLADGPAARVGRLRGYGNAINAEVAKAFIASYMETQGLDLI